jgi:sec-independent protein translocase protein TatA
MPTPGPLELVIILVIALLILGPGKLPDVGAALGKSIREFRKASSDVQDAVKVNVDTTPLPPNTLSSQAVPNETTVPEPKPVAEAPQPGEPVATGTSGDSKPVQK